MGYYGEMRGDYYRGDYYRGDPFLGFLGGLIGKGVKLLTGGGGGGAMKSLSKIGEKVGPIVTKMGKSKGTIGVLGAGAGIEAYKHRKKLEHLVGMGGGRRRRMRVTNPKALRRAIRRTSGFAKLAMRTIHLVHPRKKVRFGGFKKRKRAA